MANYRDQFIESVREVRRFSVQSLGHQNTKTAFERSARSIADVTLNAPNGAKFYERDSMDLSKVYITHNGRRYPLELISGSLSSDTLNFFVGGMIDYHNYQILMDKAKGFYDVREVALNENQTMDVISLVGDALVAEGQNINSVKLDVAFLQKNSLGTLNTPVIGFENALFCAFGPYDEHDPQIQNFINSVCDAVPEANRDSIRQTVINCFNNAMQRAAALENINAGVDIIINGFSGVDYHDFHARANQIYANERNKYPLLDQYEQANTDAFNRIERNNARISELNHLIESQRTSQQIEDDIEEKRRMIERLQRQIEQNNEGILRLNSSGRKAEWIDNARNKYLNQNSEFNRQIDEINGTIALLEQEYGIVTGTLTDEMGRRVPLTSTPTSITIDGVTRQVVNPAAVEQEIEIINQQSTTIRSQITERDAYLISAYSLMLYAIDFRHLGGEVVDGLKVLEMVGHLESDLHFDSEEIKQALSIANNLTKLLDQDLADGNTQLLDMRTTLKENIFEIFSRYSSMPEGDILQLRTPEFDINVLDGLIMGLCSNELTQDGQPNPFFNRSGEIYEKMSFAVADQTKVHAMNRVNHIEEKMRKMNPALKKFSVRHTLVKYYAKEKLVPVKAFKVKNLKYILEDEYKPRRTIDPLPPQPPEPPKPLDFCQQMAEALRRESEALGGHNTLVNRRNSKGDHFDKHYHEKLNGVIKKFESFIGNPAGFEQYQNDLMTRINNGETLSEEECLMVRFCPQFNPVIKEYADRIVAANASEDPAQIEQLRVKGKMLPGNSIFPHPLNEGMKAAILSIQLQCPHEVQGDGKIKFLAAGPDFKFDVSQMTPEFIKAFGENMEEVGEQFKAILNDPEFQKFKNFMTLEIVDGRIVVTNSTYLGTDGKYYSSNPYDNRSMSDKGHGVNYLARIQSGYITVLDGDSVKRITIDEYRSGNPDEKQLIQISPGEYVKSSEYVQINQMAISAAQNANSKNPPAPPAGNGKVQVIPVKGIEHTRDSDNQSTSGPTE